jgi:uncharacterized membrane protein
MALGRARGALLRFVRRRPLAIATGLVMAAPAAWVEMTGRYASWWTDGLALVLGATGVALVWVGVTGPAPDWVDPG